MLAHSAGVVWGWRLLTDVFNFVLKSSRHLSHHWPERFYGWSCFRPSSENRSSQIQIRKHKLSEGHSTIAVCVAGL